MSIVSRVVAFAVAVALVVAAVLVRDGGDGGGPGRDAIGGDPLAAGCPAELRELCVVAVGEEGVAWSHASARVHAAALEGREPTAVLLPAAWADVADDARARAGEPALARSEVLASSPLLLVGFRDRMEVLAAACGVDMAAIGWSCLGQHAGQRWEDLGGDVRWGDVVVGHLPPDAATGLLATTAVIAARTGTPFSLGDLRDVAFTSWFGQVERAVADFTPPGGSHLTAMVTRGPSSANVAMATEAETATRGLDTTFGPLVVAVPDPLYLVELVVAGTDPDAVEALAGRVDRGALADAGWRTDGRPPTAAPVPDLPSFQPGPDGGVLTAVLQAWQDVAG